ncbi:MAG: protein kinase [Planctomycetes bacterium]|nr:protein kinase [Planctomycetota bacterium]
MTSLIPKQGVPQIGRFEVLSKIGQGGMSTVFKARNPVTDEIVAIKLASRAVVGDPQLVRRFELEYATAKVLSHRNLVKFFDYGTHGQLPFLVMEYIEGCSLTEAITQKKHLREHEALSAILPIADALIYLHKRQIIHRDVKPANILVGANGQIKLADLGLIKDLGSLSRLTKTKMALGSLHFAAPEQFEDASTADERCDVYSLAATLHTALTGECPFGTGTITTLLHRKMTNQYDASISKLPGIRPAVDLAIRMALQADPARRPKSVSEFVAYLTGWKSFPADLRLPGGPTQQGPTKVSKKTGQERRKALRFETDVPGNCRPALGSAAQVWDSAVIDLSTTGLCLQCNRRFEPGIVLQVALSSDLCEDVVPQLARVRWIKPADNKLWIHGCEFVHPFTDEELNGLISDLMERTKMR